MTTIQLLDWIISAHDHIRYLTYEDKPPVCLKEALLKCEPNIKDHGFESTKGDRDLAIILAYTCSFDEILETADLCREPVREPEPTPSIAIIPTPTPPEIEVTPELNDLFNAFGVLLNDPIPPPSHS